MRCEGAVIHIVCTEDNIPILIGEDFSNFDDTYVFYIKITLGKRHKFRILSLPPNQMK